LALKEEQLPKRTETQTQKVFSMLRNAGGRGVSNLEFNEAGIQRYGGYVHALGKQGHTIYTFHIKGTVFMYSLHATIPAERFRELSGAAIHRRVELNEEPLTERALELLATQEWVITLEFTQAGILRLGPLIKHLRDDLGHEIESQRISDDPDEDTGWRYKLLS